MTMDDDLPLRRSRDVDPAVELYVQDVVRDTRHALRNDIAALAVKVETSQLTLAAKVETSQLVSTQEHAEVKAQLEQLAREVAVVKTLASKVAALETSDAVDHAEKTATQKLLERQRNQFFLLAGLIVSCAAVIVAVIQG